MKYEYSVKYNGKWYKPGEELPEEIETENKSSEEVIENDKRTGGKPKPRNTDKG